MKKCIVATVCCLLLSSLPVGGFAQTASLPASEHQAKTVGMLRMEQTAAISIQKDAAKQIGRNRKVVFYDSLQPLVRDLSKGKLDRAALPEFTVDYLRGRDPEGPLVLSVQSGARYFSAFSLATYQNKDLRDKLNTALTDMAHDGTTNKLVKLYVTGLPGDVEPAKVEIPLQKDVPAVKVLVTGSLPPLDFLDKDGQPAGFNALFMREIGKRTGLNIQFVRADVKTAFNKLKAHEADIIFAYSVTTVVDNNTIVSSYDDGDDPSVNLTQPYLEVPVRLLKLQGASRR